jgi:cytoskeletal protein CcmA (bactofilin family)
VIAFAQAVRMNGQVDGNVRTFNNNVTISGTVGKNVMSFAQLVTLDSNGKAGGSLTAFAQTLNVDGSVGRDVLVFSERANLSGKIGGGVRAKGETLTITSTAVIDGPVKFEGAKQAEVSPSAKLASPVEFTQVKKRETYRESGYYIWQVIWGAAFIVFGLVLFALMPDFSRDAVKSAEQYGAAAGLGVLVLFGVPIAAVIACITVVGLFIGISAFFIWYASLYFAQIIVGTVVGQWLMGRTNELWPLIGRMAVGVVIVRLCTTIPHVGGLVKFVAILWGIGAIALAVYRRFQPVIAPRVPSGPLTTPMPPNTTVGGTLPA